MVTFAPPELRSSLAEAIQVWSGFNWDFPEGLVPPEEWDDTAAPETEISLATTISMSFPDNSETFLVNCAEFVDLMEEFSTAKLVDNIECRTKRRMLVRVAPVNETASLFMRNAIPLASTPEEAVIRDQLVAQHKVSTQYRRALPPSNRPLTPDENEVARLLSDALSTEVQIHNRFLPRTRRFCSMTVDAFKEMHVSLVSGFTMFGLAIVAKGLDHFGGALIDAQTPYVEITFASQPTELLLQSVLHGFLFELQSSQGLAFRQEGWPAPYNFEEDALPYENTRFRPLMTGESMATLLQLHTKAVSTCEPEIQILYCAKVVEYVAQTVIRTRTVEEIRAKLLSSRALNPDVNYITELQSIVAKAEKSANTDGEGIKQTVLKCCDATELAGFAPKCIDEFQARSLSSDRRTKDLALTKFANTLYSTRNAIAHAKANYKPTGNECPSDELTDLAACALCAAEMAIRWFYTTPEQMRVY